MTKATKRILMSVFTLVLTLVALGTTTFAWFSLGTVSQVKGFEGKVQAGEGLEIRMRLAKDYVGEDAAEQGWTSWKTHLNEDDWTTVWNGLELEQGEEFRFTAIEHGLDGVNDENGFSKFKANDDGYLVQGDKTVANTDYLAVEFQFRSQSNEKQVALTNIEFIDAFTEGTEAYQVTADLDIEMTATTENESTLKIESEDGETTVSINPVNALRVTMTNGTEDDTKHYYSGHNVGENHITSLGQWDFLTKKGNKFFENDGDAPINTPLAYTHDEITETEGLLDEKSLVLKGFTEIAGTDYFGASLTMFLWLDGWDPHTFDVIFQKEFAANFTFALVEVA